METAYVRPHVHVFKIDSHVFKIHQAHISRHTDSKKSRRRSTKKFQAPYLAKQSLELFGRTIFAERQVSRSLVRDSGRKQKVKQRNRSTADFQATLSPGGSPGSLLSKDVCWIFNSLCVSTLLRLVNSHTVHGQETRLREAV